MSDTQKCSIKKLTFCPAMDRMCQAGAVKGLASQYVVKMDTGEISLLGIVYRESARDQGIMINACPWCRSRLDGEMRKRSKKAKP